MPDTSSFPRTVFATLFASPQLFSHLLYHLIASFVCTLGNMAPKQQRVMESDEETLVLSPSCQANRDPPSPAPAVSDDPRDVPPGGFVILSDGTTAGTMPDSMMNPYTMSIINNMMGLLNRGSSSNNLGGNGDSQVSPVAVFVGNNSGQYMEMNEGDEEGDDDDDVGAEAGEAATSSTIGTTSDPKSKAKAKASKKKKCKGKRHGK